MDERFEIQRTTRSLWFEKPGMAALIETPLPPRQSGFSLVSALSSGISPGTENLVFCGNVPALLHPQMKVPYMEGEFSFPVKYGYSMVGQVKVTDDPALQGRLVHLLHPHSRFFLARNQDLFVFENIPPARATLASNLETAVNAVWDSGVSIGQSCLVVGFGIIGSLVVRLLSRIPEVKVVVADSNPQKLAMAAAMGFQTFAPGQALANFDLAFHASSSGEGLQLCLDHTGFEARIVELSWYGNRKINLELGGDFHSKRKAIVASQVSAIAPAFRGRWDFLRRKQLVFALLKDPAFDRHVTHTIPFAESPEYYNQGGLTAPGLARVIDYN